MSDRSNRGRLRLDDLAPDPRDKRAPWDMLLDETPRAYQWFRRYARLPADQRSFARVLSDAHGEATGSGHNAGQKTDRIPPLSSMKRWSTRHHWAERVREWDNEVARREWAAHADARVESAKRHATIARATVTALSRPVRALLERLDSRDPTVREEAEAELATMTAPELIALIGRLTPALTTAMSEERATLGLVAEATPPPPAPPEDGDAPAGLLEMDSVERMAAVLSVLEEAGFKPRSEEDS